MDVILIAVMVAVLWAVSWLAYSVGRAQASQVYASALATERAKVRRLTRDLDTAYDQAAMRRRGGAA